MRLRTLPGLFQRDHPLTPPAALSRIKVGKCAARVKSGPAGAHKAEYVFHPEVEQRFKKDIRDDRIVVMPLPTNEEIESGSRKFRELFG